MNFEHMPELRWLLGYPMALTLMVVSGIIPFIYFKRKDGCSPVWIAAAAYSTLVPALTPMHDPEHRQHHRHLD